MNPVGHYGVNAYSSYINRYENNTQKVEAPKSEIESKPQVSSLKSQPKVGSATNTTTPQLLPSASAYTRRAASINNSNSMPGQHIDIKL